MVYWCQGEDSIAFELTVIGMLSLANRGYPLEKRSPTTRFGKVQRQVWSMRFTGRNSIHMAGTRRWEIVRSTILLSANARYCLLNLLVVDNTERVIASNVFEEKDFPSMISGRVALLGDGIAIHPLQVPPLRIELTHPVCSCSLDDLFLRPGKVFPSATCRVTNLI